MNSIQEVRHELLWDLAAGRAGTPELKAHVDCCPDCAALIASFSRLHSALQRTEPGIFAVCPSAAGLSAFQARELPSGEIDEVSRHLESCGLCRDEIHWLESTGPDRARSFPVKRALAWGAAAAVLLLAALPALLHRGAPASPYADLAQVPKPDRSDLVRALGLPQRFQPQLDQALAAYQAKNYGEAEAQAAGILAVLPSDPSALFVMALAAHARGDPAAATRFMTQSERSQPMTGYRCWAALQIALINGDHPAIERECGHLRAYALYASRAAGILAEVRRRRPG